MGSERLCLTLALLAVLLLSTNGARVEEGGECEEGAGLCPGEEDARLVVELTDKNFTETVQETDMVVVQFYAPWCHHCHDLAPIYTEVARILKPHGILLAKVNVVAAREVQSRFQIRDVPHLTIFWKGLAFPYAGPGDRTGAQVIADYLLEQQQIHDQDKEVVITLTGDNFDPIVATADLILVEFYADWCVHCQRLEPHYARAARRLRDNDPPILLGKVKVPEEMEVAKRFGISGYPLLLVFRQGKRYNYTGPREEEGIVQYMVKQVGPPSTVLQSAKEAIEFSTSEETMAIGFFSKETDPKLLLEFMESGNLLRMDLSLGHATDPEVAKEMGFPLESVVIFHPRHLVSKYEPGYSIISELPSSSTEMAYLYLSSRPLVGEMTKLNFDRTYRHRPLLVAYYEVNWDREAIKATQYYHDMIASVATDFPDSELVFAVANEGSYQEDLRALGLTEWGEDVAVGLFAPGLVKYRMLEELTPETLREFIQSFLNGELTPHLSSERAPRETKGTLVKTVVGSTFSKIVLNPKKNVMVKLCIPSLPDCQKASEYFLKVAETFKGVKDLVFGEMNVALNDPSVGTKFESLPAFYFSAKGSGEMIPITPQPQDDADLTFFLKRKQNIMPIKTGKKKKARSKDEL